MTTTVQRKLIKLFALAEEAADNTTIHLQFVIAFNRLRLEFGLARLLLLIQEYSNATPEKIKD